MMESIQGDTLIIGGGSAGCALAARLSADPNRQVILFEAGPDDQNLPAASPLPKIPDDRRPALRLALYDRGGSQHGQPRPRVGARQGAGGIEHHQRPARQSRPPRRTEFVARCYRDRAALPRASRNRSLFWRLGEVQGINDALRVRSINLNLHDTAIAELKAEVRFAGERSLNDRRV
jgi:choline dehydrogenase-like flavoprotein